VNANDATLTGLATAQTGSRVADNTPNAPASGSYRGRRRQRPGQLRRPLHPHDQRDRPHRGQPPWPPQTLRQAFDATSGWKLSGTGPDYECIQTFPILVPGGGPGGPLAGHTLQCVASLVSRGAQIASIIHSAPFVLV
jgi:hypothetical protein